MKKIRSAALAVVVIAVTTVGVIAVAQMSQKGPHGHGHNLGDFTSQHEQMLDHLSEMLKLSDQQKTQARQILADSKPLLQSLHERLKEAHKSTLELGTNGVFDEQKAQEVAGQQAQIMKQLLVQTARTHAQLFAILTPEQREQAKQLMNQFFEH
jgi:Spy/CpxP family protein refolding chaperone